MYLLLKIMENLQKVGVKIITTINDKTIKEPMCSKCPTKKATYFANAWGKEKYLCDECAKRFKFKNQDIPNDLWFCKKIKN